MVDRLVYRFRLGKHWRQWDWTKLHESRELCNNLLIFFSRLLVHIKNGHLKAKTCGNRALAWLLASSLESGAINHCSNSHLHRYQTIHMSWFDQKRRVERRVSMCPILQSVWLHYWWRCNDSTGFHAIFPYNHGEVATLLLNFCHFIFCE
jgi:hypothetical protein